MSDDPMLSRRGLLAASVPLLGSPRGIRSSGAAATPTVIAVDISDPRAIPFDREAAGIVGVYDIDWLTRPGFGRLLDNLAASPGAFSGVRVFGAFTAGQPEAIMPEGGGTVWEHPDGAIDFSTTYDALAALTSRGLTPFVVLGFFPPAVSASPIAPPVDWSRWSMLVDAFLRGLAADARFGEAAIARWWFEVWNEPNEGRFWSGTPDDYLALYRATSAAVVATGLPVRLGGPAIAYKPQASPADGAPWMERFLRFIAADPDLRCDFVSLHRKGTVGDDPPDPRRLLEAFKTTAELTLAIDPARFAGLTIVNNEADEKVGFEVPYAPRMDHRAAAWLGTATAIAAALDRCYAADGLRFVAAADNANLHLVRAPFDGRRSLMTVAGPVPDEDGSAADATDLLKLPVYGLYEMVRLMGVRQVPVTADVDALFPATDLSVLATAADTHVAVLATRYRLPGHDPTAARTVELTVARLPWSEVNVALFQIDATRSNAYTAAGGDEGDPFPVPERIERGAIRGAQELTTARPMAHGVVICQGTYRETVTLAANATLCLWITPVSSAAPAPPTSMSVQEESVGTVVSWEPSQEPSLYSYEVLARDVDVVAGDNADGERISPMPLRSALWVDTTATPGRRYGVRAVSASGVVGPLLDDECPDHSGLLVAGD